MATVKLWSDEDVADVQYEEFLTVVGMAAGSNNLANSMQIPVDRELLIG